MFKVRPTVRIICSEIDGKVTYGDVKEKEKAKKVYQEARRRGQSAGLVSQRSAAGVQSFEWIPVNIMNERRLHIVHSYIHYIQPC